MATQMKAAVYYGAGDVRIEQVAAPVPGPGEVLIRVTRSGVCGTDASEWKSGPNIFPVHRTHPHSGHHGPLILGLGPTQMVLLAVTVVVAVLTVVPGRATRLQGAVHLALLASFVFLAVNP